jgi:hypothetical protein
MLIVSTNSISVSRNQPAPCHPPRLVVSPRLIRRTKSGPPTKRITGARRREGATTGRGVGTELVGISDPDGGDDKKHHAERRDHKPEPHGFADVGVVVAQIIGIVMHSHLLELPNSLLERLRFRRRGRIPWPGSE